VCSKCDLSVPGRSVPRVTEPADLRETRTAYDTVATDYAELLRDELAGRPLDRALLAAFAEHVQEAGGGPVADLGCGPGRITTHLSALGLDAFGVDLSPAMVEVARRDHPQLRFVVGSIDALELPDGGLGGALAWYSVIHTPAERLPAVFAEFARVLRPGAPVLIAFQAGDEQVHLQQGYGHPISLRAWRRNPDQVARLLEDAGFRVRARVLREPEPPKEQTPQAYLLATAG
jgi:ubiquinone/menaquinone biosynthesis C-methylase UbiE